MRKLIDADTLKRKCQKVATETWKMKIKASAEVIMNQFIDFIDEADTVDAVPVRHGHWIEDTDGWEYQCSECRHLSACQTVYCSACGARMDGEGNGNG